MKNAIYRVAHKKPPVFGTRYFDDGAMYQYNLKTYITFCVQIIQLQKDYYIQINIFVLWALLRIAVFRSYSFAKLLVNAVFAWDMRDKHLLILLPNHGLFINIFHFLQTLN